MDVKTLCLGVLTMGEASGYDIRQYFEKGPFSHFCQAGYGSIYPALAKALDEGLVTCRTESQGGRPDKKMYTITETGEAHLKARLHQPLTPDRIRSDYLVSFLFGGMIEPEHLAKVYDDYHKAFADNAALLSSLECDGVSPGKMFVRELGITMYSSVAKHLSDNREQFLTSVHSGEKS